MACRPQSQHGFALRLQAFHGSSGRDARRSPIRLLSRRRCFTPSGKWQFSLSFDAPLSSLRPIVCKLSRPKNGLNLVGVVFG